ncbi:LAFE_0C10814g1_1 [Lachancea fermentati]|uniref:LAFE_0C10814g1_1 n=1 Tax=Lachancea fermentati TaxID=4955 RepID=A0A1G4MA62_LACFM|nr:LAFE_0C10814g1_1 [Lachancea fermentati]
MGLLTIIKKQKRKDRELRCLVLGLDNAGKSTLVERLVEASKGAEAGAQAPAVAPTVGFRIHTLVLDDRNVQLWDVGGQSTLRPYWSNYFDKTDVLVWVVDVAAAARAHESQHELCALLRDRDRLGYNCRIMVLLNKTDLVDAATAAARTAAFQRELDAALALDNVELTTYATSGATAAGVDAVLAGLAGPRDT